MVDVGASTTLASGFKCRRTAVPRVGLNGTSLSSKGAKNAAMAGETSCRVLPRDMIPIGTKLDLSDLARLCMGPSFD